MHISPRKLIQEPQMRSCSSHLSNKNVLSSFRNESKLNDGSFILAGRSFQIVGPQTLNDLGPNVTCEYRTSLTNFSININCIIFMLSLKTCSLANFTSFEHNPKALGYPANRDLADWTTALAFSIDTKTHKNISWNEYIYIPTYLIRWAKSPNCYSKYRQNSIYLQRKRI